MAAAKKAKKAVKSATLKFKKGDKSYTKSKLVAHLAESVSAAGVGPVTKKQAAAFLESLTAVLFDYAAVGAPLPGVGKLLVRKTKARPERQGVNPKTGQPLTIPAKKAGQKLVFRVLKAARDKFAV